MLRAHAALEAWLARNRLAPSTTTARRPSARRRCSPTPATAPTRSAPSAWAAGPGEAVVDGRCAAFGTPGLFVVSTAVLPTSGQANPTLTAVQLGLRLADDLAAGRV